VSDHRDLEDQMDTDPDDAEVDELDGPVEGASADPAVDLVEGGSTEEGPSGDGSVEEGHLAYDCAAWAGETRAVLRSLLVSQDIPHAWQGTTLTVRDEDEALVDGLIDEVAGSARPALDPDVVRVVYEVGEWPVGLQTRLADELAMADVAYEWDERGDLVVAEADEEQVEAVLADLPDPDESQISSDDGVAVHELLDSVFMSSDRLARNGGDASGTVALVDAAEVVEQLALPFGFEPGQWRTFVGRVLELRDALGGQGAEGGSEGASDVEIAELAAGVRDLVRQYV
jgi:hypothetical protein